MKRKIYKSITLAMILGIILFPSQSMLYAQVEDQAANAESTEVKQELEIVPLVDNNIVLQDSIDTPIVQDTFNVQESVDQETLSTTATDTEIIIDTSSENNQEEVNDNQNTDSLVSTSTPKGDDSSQGDTDTNNTDNNTINDNNTDNSSDNTTNEDTQVDTQKDESPVIDTPVVEDTAMITVTKPKPMYKFTFSKNVTAYKKITNPAKEAARLAKEKQVLNKKSKIANAPIVEDKFIPDTIDAPIDNVVSQNIDNESGAMTLTGTCSDTYFVVLLYKNQSDYTEDRGSYILNKAFKCENGSFSYSISDLPSNLETGTYYMLIGDQGSRGTWTPATQLTEININREQ